MRKDGLALATVAEACRTSKSELTGEGEEGMRKEMRGSKEAIQVLANERTEVFEAAIEGRIRWLSPLKADKYHEYCNSFPELDLPADWRINFWPKRGPHWDGLAIDETRGEYLLIEAKSHISEIFESGSRADDENARKQISSTLETLAKKLHAPYWKEFWEGSLYQTANRLAFLDHLNANTKHWRGKIKLVYLIILNDPIAKEQAICGVNEDENSWLTAIYMALHKMLAIPKRNVLTKHFKTIFIPHSTLYTAEDK